MSRVDFTSFSLLLAVFVPGRGLAAMSQLSSIPMQTASLKKESFFLMVLAPSARWKKGQRGWGWQASGP